MAPVWQRIKLLFNFLLSLTVAETIFHQGLECASQESLAQLNKYGQWYYKTLLETILCTYYIPMTLHEFCKIHFT